MDTRLQHGPRYIYITGAATGVGKSTVCAGFLAWLTVNGYAPDRLAYIKPMTQCVEVQPVARFCERMEIAHRGIGSLVFRKGFTREFIEGHTPTSEALRARVLDEITEVSDRKEIVVIDAVGGPADGSVIGLSNVDIVKALPCQVVFVGKPGIGAAIDSTVLCASFMQGRGISSIQLLYNKVPNAVIDGVKRCVAKRIVELMPDAILLGFIGDRHGIDDRLQTENVPQIAEWFARHVNRKLLPSRRDRISGC